jgi:uncharacterized protein YlxW (UPF0749 family)
MNKKCEDMKVTIEKDKKNNLKKLKDEEQSIKKLNQESGSLKKELYELQLKIRSHQVKINDNKRFIKHR